MAHAVDEIALTGTDLEQILAALAHPQRLRILAALAGRRNYVSQLAREIQMSRTLLHMHLARLEAAGLVRSEMEVSDDGKAMRYVEPTPFSICLTPEVISSAMGRERAEED
ncbi:MAG: ArsR family transcriptional regulator [Chloroflexi bacterium]|nr:ArsR family transcriptional regulator [Chloroflexota bacterium]